MPAAVLNIPLVLCGDPTTGSGCGRTLDVNEVVRKTPCSWLSVRSVCGVCACLRGLEERQTGCVCEQRCRQTRI